MFAGRNSPKVTHLTTNPNASVLITNQVGEPEGWVAFDGKIHISDFNAGDWVGLLDRIAPKYWDLSNAAHAQTLADWREAPEAMVSLEMTPDRIRSGA